VSFGGQNQPVEICVAPDDADDLRDGYVSYPEVALHHGGEGAVYLLEGEQPVGARVPPRERLCPVQERLLADAGTILLGLLAKVQV
jgi:hypothetical protein